MTLAIDNSGDWALVDGTVFVTLQRQSTGAVKDSSGGPVTTWIAVAVNVVADIQPVSGQVKKRFVELGLEVSHTIFLAQDVQAVASDRLVSGTRQFQVVAGGYEFGFGLLTGWPGTAHVVEVLGEP